MSDTVKIEAFPKSEDARYRVGLHHEVQSQITHRRSATFKQVIRLGIEENKK